MFVDERLFKSSSEVVRFRTSDEQPPLGGTSKSARISRDMNFRQLYLLYTLIIVIIDENSCHEKCEHFWMCLRGGVVRPTFESGRLLNLT